MAASGRAVIDVFYGTVKYLLDRGVSLIAELSFRRGLDEPQLQQLANHCRMVNIHCQTTTEVAQQRFFARRHSRRPTPRADMVGAAMAGGTFDWSVFEPLDLPIPRLCVATTAEYAPDLAEIVAFCHDEGDCTEGNDAVSAR
ncbi:MAG TPA: hypothetical protein VIL85_19140 [Thermomicrobiales bacterium]